MAKQLDQMTIITSYTRDEKGNYTQTDITVEGIASDPSASNQGDSEPRALRATHIFIKAQTVEEMRDQCLTAIKAKWAIP